MPAPEEASLEAPATLSRFLSDARAFDADLVVPFRDDARAVQLNAELGVRAVMEFEGHVREHLPHVDLDELRSLSDLALCLAHAAEAVDGGGIEAAEARQLVAEAHALRRVMRASLSALVQASVLSPRDIAKIGGDHGSIDVGADCIAMATLFQKRAEDLVGKTPVTTEQIARASEIGAKLRAAAKPKSSARKLSPNGASAVDTRDRLWTLLLARHERLWAVGAYIYGHAVDEYVPPLTASSPKAKKPAKTKEA